MKSGNGIRLATATALLGLFVATAVAAQGVGASGPWTDIALSSGIQMVNETAPAFPDLMTNIPLSITATYHVSPRWAVEGEFTWVIAMEQAINIDNGPEMDRKTPDMLACQISAVACLAPNADAWMPYVAAGVGTMSFISNDDPDRQPALSESQTALAVNFGLGTSYQLTPVWAIRVDFREFVAFPADDAWRSAGIAESDPVWMERGSLGIVRRF